MIMEIKLQKFDSEGKEISREIVKSEAEGLEKIGSANYYLLHKCRHNENPPQPCELIKKKMPVIIDEIINP